MIPRKANQGLIFHPVLTCSGLPTASTNMSEGHEMNDDETFHSLDVLAIAQLGIYQGENLQ